MKNKMKNKMYEVNANGNRTFSASTKAAVRRVAKTWKRLGYEPRMYCVDGDPVTVTQLAI